MSDTKLSSTDYAFLPYIFTDNIYVLEDEKSAIKTLPVEALMPHNPPTSNTTKTAPVPAKEEAAAPKIEFSGKNLKKVLVVLPEDKSLFTPEIKDFLFKILAAVNHKEDDIAICFAGADLKVEHLSKQIAFNYLISFGVDKLLNFAEKYKVLKAGNTSFLSADNLTAISGDASRKRALWESLKRLFAI